MAATRSTRAHQTRSSSKRTSSAAKTQATHKKGHAVRKQASSSRKKATSGKRQPNHTDEDTDENTDEDDHHDTTPEPTATQQHRSSATESGQCNSGSNNIQLTLDNFESQLDNWSILQLRQTLNKNKDTRSNRIPPEVQDRLTLLQKNYTKSKLMLGLIGNISEGTVNKWLGENKPARRKSGWNRYVAFSVESANTPVPPPGCSIGWEERNVHLGEAWALLSEEEKDVFSPVIFQYFSKIPCQPDTGDDDEDTEIELTPEEIELYQPLYAKLVNQEKVDLIISEGVHIGINNSKAFEQAERSVEKLNGELFTMSTLYNTTYYLLAATRDSGVKSFCKEWSNDVAWLALAKKNWKAKEKFEAYSHGREIQEAVEDASGVSTSKQLREANQLKKDLRAALNQTLANTLGIPVKGCIFPKVPNPSARLLKKNRRLEIVQSEGSTLPKEELMKGFNKMENPFKKKWIDDIRSGAFKIVLSDN
ncbi:hypothetical protein PGTUg99_050041 [Puccinia graminis f. sp. tritici]|uniref:Uncharacterized protein n=1 Tax=Puccinia graminis f. sp. tritici TaxID=56615 RepID=A0A5B0MNU5_PUCGR|nr:hypothetical protein PGTUg99_050041 [Puccinia graminis f. sp. tritici]